MNGNEKIIRSSGNIFADLGPPNPDEDLAKAKLALAVIRKVDALELTPVQVATLIGTSSAKLKQLRAGKLSAFTYDSLVKFLQALGCDVEITITSHQSADTGRQGRITVAA